MNGLNISTAPLASPTNFSGPPPPYSYAPATIAPATGHNGYMSPPESTTRRSTRDENLKDSPPTRQSLPSIHEALGDKSLPFTAPLSATTPQHHGSTPTTAVTQSFPEGPKGPSNPFSQPPPTFRENPFSATSQPVPPPPPPDIQQSKPAFTPISQESRPPVSQSFAHPASPRSAPSVFRPNFNSHNESAPPHSPVHPEHSRQSYSFPSLSNQGPSGYTSEPYRFSSNSKYQDQRPPFPRGPDMSYGDTVKRHLDVFDAELGLNDVCDPLAI